jgi:hypothetical protein
MKSNEPQQKRISSGKSKTKLNCTKVFLAVGSTWLIVIFWLLFQQSTLEQCENAQNELQQPIVYSFIGIHYH